MQVQVYRLWPNGFPKFSNQFVYILPCSDNFGYSIFTPKLGFISVFLSLLVLMDVYYHFPEVCICLFLIIGRIKHFMISGFFF